MRQQTNPKEPMMEPDYIENLYEKMMEDMATNGVPTSFKISSFALRQLERQAHNTQLIKETNPMKGLADKAIFGVLIIEVPKFEGVKGPMVALATYVDGSIKVMDFG
jgi:hypothetical protein